MSSASWPRPRSAVTSVLSRMQLPQYIPAAPAVMNAILMRDGDPAGRELPVTLAGIPPGGEGLTASLPGSRGRLADAPQVVPALDVEPAVGHGGRGVVLAAAGRF